MGKPLVHRQVRRKGADVKRVARRANRQVKKAATNPWFERTARLGYVVRGVLYGVMGILAIDLALGGATSTTDQRGGVYLLATNPATKVLLVVVIVALAGYSLWGFVRAVYDPLNRGDDATGMTARMGFAWSGLNYLALTIFAATVLLGNSRTQDDPVQSMVNKALALPPGGILVVVAGAIAVVAGVGQFVDAYKAGFKRDLKRTRMSRVERVAVDSLGRFGMVSRGVIFSVVGIFLLQAGLHHDAAEAHGFGPAFRAIAGEPLGHVLLALVALGFVALGLHSFANARWIRMPNR